MSPKQIRLVQETWKLVEPISEQAAAMFYERLFHLEPSLRPLFKSDMKQQGRKLMQTLAVVVSNLTKMDTILPVIEDLGRRHVDYGVTEEQYDTVGEALLWTLEQGLDEAFTREVKEAWAAAYVGVSKLMKEAAYMPA